MTDDEEQKRRTLWCGNLTDSVSEELLFELFLQAGPLETVRIATDRDGRKKGFAFITFKHAESVPYTIQLMNGMPLFKRSLLLQTRSGSSHVVENNTPAGNPLMQPSLHRSFSAPAVQNIGGLNPLLMQHGVLPGNMQGFPQMPPQIRPGLLIQNGHPGFQMAQFRSPVPVPLMGDVHHQGHHNSVHIGPGGRPHDHDFRDGGDRLRDRSVDSHRDRDRDRDRDRSPRSRPEDSPVRDTDIRQRQRDMDHRRGQHHHQHHHQHQHQHHDTGREARRDQGHRDRPRHDRDDRDRDSWGSPHHGGRRPSGDQHSRGHHRRGSHGNERRW